MLNKTESDEFVRSFTAASECVHANVRAKGFWDKERNRGELLMLIVSELAEALEYLRHGSPASDHISEFSGVEEEMADVVIRVMDLAGGLHLRLAEAIVAKMAFNEAREHKHGKQF